MAADYRVLARSTAGVKIGDITDFLWLAYTKLLGLPGLLKLGLPAGHRLIPLLAQDCQLEVWRRNLAIGLPWYVDFFAFFLGRQESNSGGQDFYTAVGPGQLDLLDRRIVAWYAGTNLRSDFVAAKGETVMKNLVSYNAGANATIVNGRLADGTFGGKTITIQADAAGGNSIDISAAWLPLLTTLQKVALKAGGDYDLIKTGPTTWDFRWYVTRRGVDRHLTVNFATNFGNMVDPSYTADHSKEVTVVVVGGPGLLSARQIVTRTGVAYSAANKLEAFLDDRGDNSVAQFNTAGDAALFAGQFRDAFAFTTRQTPGCAYGLHYAVGGALGDLVTVRRNAYQSGVQKLMGATVAYAPDGAETIDLTLLDQT